MNIRTRISSSALIFLLLVSAGSFALPVSAIAQTAAQCSNNIDDDGDGKVDLADPGCVSPGDNSEANASMFPPVPGQPGSPTQPSWKPQCSDNLDNDGDGKVDLADPGCTSTGDDNEFNSAVFPPVPNPNPGPNPNPNPNPNPFVPACRDGIDNDGDGKIDLADPGCASLNDTNEANAVITPPGGGFTPACSNNIDDDGDGLVDLSDPGCSSSFDTTEFNAGQNPVNRFQCNDGIDNDGDGKIDLADPGCITAQDDQELNTTTPPQTVQCNDGIDNDGDGLVDLSDPGCSSSFDNSEFNSTNQNLAPVCSTIGNRTVNVNQTASFTVPATDPNGDQLTYAITSGSPLGASFNSSNGFFSFTPQSFQQNQTFFLNFRVSDPSGLSCTTSASISVSDFSDGGGNNNNAPVFTNIQTNYYINVNQNLRFTVSAYDPDGSFVTLFASSLPQGASFYSNFNTGSQATREFSWTPQNYQTGTFYVTFRAVDGQGMSSERQVVITVYGDNNNCSNYGYGYNYNNCGNNCYDVYGNYICGQGGSGNPYFTSSPSTIAEAGQTYIYDANAYDPEGDQITYSLNSGPSGTYVNPTTGVLAWVVPNSAAGQTFSFSIKASDYRGGVAYQNFSVTVRGTVIYPPYTPPPSYPPVYNPPVYTPPAATAKLSTFNIRVTTDENNNIWISWDNNKPTRGEVLFGFTTQPDTKLLNYDATTGQTPEINTHHDVNLGQLQLRATYYMRIISRTGAETDTTQELIVIPLPYTEGGAVTDNGETASAFDNLADFLTSGWFLLFILLLILVLVIYLLVSRRRETIPGASHSFEPHS